jgi:P27 family predicted phage terminase small subunit
MKGRKPKLTVIEGGSAPGRCPGPPSWLTLYAQREWKRVAPALHRRRLLAADTMAVLEAFCVAAGQVRECEETMAREGRMIAGEDGPKPHPAFRMQHVAIREARLLATELGVTPHRRGKEEDAPKRDPWEGMLG